MKSGTEAPTSHDHHHAMHASHESPGKHDLHRPVVAGVHGASAAHDRHEGHSVAMFRDGSGSRCCSAFRPLSGA